MSLLAVGVSHRSSPLPVLERVAVAASDAPLTELVRASPHVTDAVVLATCNRVEVYAEVSRFHGGLEDITRVLSDACDVAPATLVEHLYVHYDAAAAEHLFRVAAGLDSMAPGESQILGQVRGLWQRATSERELSAALEGLLRAAVRAGRRAQSETGLDRVSNVLVEHAIDEATAVLATPVPRTVLIGAGSMAAVVAASLRRRARGGDMSWLTVVNRSEEAALRTAEAAGAGARTARWPELIPLVAGAQLVVACTGAVGHVVEARALAEARSGTREPLVALDLALPRDIDPLCAALPGLDVRDLDLLGRQLSDRDGRDELAAAGLIVGEEVAAWRAAQAAVGVAPTVVALRERATAILEAELARLDRRLPELPDGSREEIRSAVRRVVEKVIHNPTVRVKQLAGAPGGTFYAEALRELFDLDVPGAMGAAVPDSVAATLIPHVPQSLAREGVADGGRP